MARRRAIVIAGWPSRCSPGGSGLRHGAANPRRAGDPREATGTMPLRSCRHPRVDSHQGVGLRPGDRQVLRVPQRDPVVLARDAPCGGARYPVAEQAELQPGHSLVGGQGGVLRASTVADIVEQQLQRLGADGVRCDDLMGGVDGHVVVDHVQQGGRVDRVAGHESDSGPPHPCTASAQDSSGRLLGGVQEAVHRSPRGCRCGVWGDLDPPTARMGATPGRSAPTSGVRIAGSAALAGYSDRE